MLTTRLQPDYTVAGLVEDLKDWIHKGYINPDVWQKLQRYVSADVLSTFSKRPRLDSQSSDHTPSSNSDSTQRTDASAHSASCEPEDDTFAINGILLKLITSHRDKLVHN